MTSVIKMKLQIIYLFAWIFNKELFAHLRKYLSVDIKLSNKNLINKNVTNKNVTNKM